MNTYNLKSKTASSADFYATVEDFTDKLYTFVPVKITSTAGEYLKYIAEKRLEEVRSQNEYLIEILILGIFWNNYAKRAVNASVWRITLLKVFGVARRHFYFVKSLIDVVRGHLLRTMVDSSYNQQIGKDEAYTIENAEKLVLYLGASNDFDEELQRVKNFLQFLKTLSGDKASVILKISSEFAEIFTAKAKESLGRFTEGVDDFIRKNKSYYMGREDLLFCLRYENEYHLNMVCAEILNREFRKEFDKSIKKIVLLPTCMRGINTNCQSYTIGLEQFCTGCRDECAIHRITKSVRTYNVETRLIPHSSDFSKFLRVWKGNKEVGLVGVACVLNLIRGGYEMRKLGIPSQCVFLDYSGCKGHWSKKGRATDINELRLKEILSVG